MQTKTKGLYKDYQTIRISRIKPSPNNTRQHPQKQIEKLTESINKFGFIGAIIVDKNYEIIAGHARFEAAKKAGFDSVPVKIVSHLTPQELRAYRILDNKIAEHANWDREALAVEFDYLTKAELAGQINFSPEITGFESAEIDQILHDAPSIEISDAQIPSLKNTPVITKSGDVWVLGRHRIACGDCRHDELQKKLVPLKGYALIVTDPPYNVKIDGFVSGKGEKKHNDFAMASGEMTPTQFEKFLYDVLKLGLNNIRDAGCVYICMDWRHTRELQAAAQRCELEQINLAIWDKGVGGMGSLYRSQHELIFIYCKSKTPERNNIQLGRYGRNRTNVWQYPSANISQQGRTALKSHPTPKPVAMIADIIKDVTKTGDAVFDPFLGGGTTLIACENTKRRCYGIEIDPIYVDASVKRWQDLTGQKATNLATGEPFAERKIRERSNTDAKEK